MSTSVIDNEVQDYVDAVASALVDLQEAQRVELLDDLASHLSEFDRTEGSLIDQLGDPIAYAHELRTSAGLTATAAPLLAPSAIEQLLSRLGQQFERVHDHRASQATTAFVPELRPAWWVARVWFILAAMSERTAADLPFPRVGGSTLLGLILLGAGIPASIQLGRAARAGHRLRWNHLLTIVGVIAALVAVSHVRDSSDSYVYVDNGFGYQTWYNSPVLGEGGTYVGEVQVPLDRDGQPLFRWDGPDQIIVDGVGRDVGPCPNDQYSACLLPLVPVTAVEPAVSGASGAKRSDDGATPSGSTGASGAATDPSGATGPATDPGAATTVPQTTAAPGTESTGEQTPTTVDAPGLSSAEAGK